MEPEADGHPVVNSAQLILPVKDFTVKKRIMLISAFDPKLNPYILLFRNALERPGLSGFDGPAVRSGPAH